MPGILKVKKRRKYGNVPCLVAHGKVYSPAADARTLGIKGLWFASQREARRWLELLQLERAGKISDLRRQVRYRLEVKGVLICNYVADFNYREWTGPGSPNVGWCEVWCEVVEDCKGTRTREYRIKRKLMKAIHEIEIREA